jgi:collagenase-like PrtC family protease
MLAEKLEMADKCIFYHETFLRNTYDILTYQESGIKKIICSKDMHLKDIKLLPKEKKDTYGIICFGYIPLYESQRKILTHYISMNKLPKSIIHSTTLSLKEHTRDDRYKVIEQEGVSSIFDSKVYSYLSYIKELSENINMFIVDSLFFETSYIKEVVELIKKAHQGIDVNEQLIKLDESISFTDRFLNKKIGLM